MKIKVIIFSAVGVTLLLAACASEATTAPPDVTTTPTAETSPSAIPAEAEKETESREDPVALGEELFQKTAGGTGCALCHGKDASGMLGPDIRDKSADDIRDALASVDAMSSISLKNEEVLAVAAYLGTISR